MKLKDRVVLITGAASKAGIGYSIAREMAAEGAYVIVLGNRKKSIVF